MESFHLGYSTFVYSLWLLSYSWGNGRRRKMKKSQFSCFIFSAFIWARKTFGAFFTTKWQRLFISFCPTLLWFSESRSHTLSIGGHFEPVHSYIESTTIISDTVNSFPCTFDLWSLYLSIRHGDFPQSKHIWPKSFGSDTSFYTPAHGSDVEIFQQQKVFSPKIYIYFLKFSSSGGLTVFRHWKLSDLQYM